MTSADTSSSSSFEDLRKRCLSKGCLFEDDDFPAIDRSIYTSQPISKHISWKRPQEFCEKPQFIVSGHTRFDLDQGALGNCWFIAAAATLATKPQLLQNVVPTDQSFSDNYAGIFHFFFWKYGVWKEVIIDDRLPVKYGNQLEFCHNKEEPDEFWSALLEKAYAKLNGSYEALLGGNIQDAMVDLTGGVSETIDLQDKSKTNDVLFSLMQRFEASNSLMGCSILILGKSGSQPLDKGLLSGHAYSITGISRITSANSKGKIRLIRILNPWGKAEWTGAWSDSSNEWSGISDETKKQLQFRAMVDGEFWMPFEEWRKTFTELQFCHLTSRSFNSKVDWCEQAIHGSWVKGVNAGGCGLPPNEQFYWNNPQYCIVIGGSGAEREVPIACSSTSSFTTSPLIVSLMQKDKRETNKNNNITIGFRLFLIRRNEPVSLDNTIFPKETITLEQGVYNQFREVAQHYEDISAGVYCVIPTTYRPDEEANFFLRVLTQQQAELRLPIKDHGVLPVLKLARMEMPVATYTLNYGTSAAPPLDTVDSVPEIEEPLLSPVRVKGLGQTPSLSDETANSSRLLTPAEREIFEVYENVVNGRCILSAENLDPNLLQRILSSLNEIGQLGCYKLKFCRGDSRLFFSLLSKSQSISFDQIRNLVETIKKWITEFAKCDRNFAEFLPFSESWKALSSLGYQLSNETKKVIALYHGAQQNGLYVSDFISCAARLSATRLFWETKTEASRVISFEELQQRILMT